MASRSIKRDGIAECAFALPGFREFTFPALFYPAIE